MSAAIGLRQDFDAATLRRMAAQARDADQARRLLALAAVYDGMSREQAARIGGMDRQTMRDWVHRFNEHGADGLIKKFYGEQSKGLLREIRRGIGLEGRGAQ
jgi:transposase